MDEERIIVRPAIPADVLFADEIIHEMEHSAIARGSGGFTVDIRNDDTYTHRQILDVIKANITVELTVRTPALRASSVPVDHPIVKTGIAIGCKTYNSPTSSDQGWLNIPSVKIGPGDSARSHTANEYIFLEEIKKGISLYVRLLDMLPLMLINNPIKNESNYINN